MPLKLFRPVRYLIGPSLCYYFPYNLLKNRRILLLGEVHVNNGFPQTPAILEKSNEVHIWLMNLVKNSPECIDLFVEHKYISRTESHGEPIPFKQPTKLIDYKTPLNAIRETFLPCYTRDRQLKNICFDPNLRYHYVDVRTINENKWILSHIYDIDRVYYHKQGQIVDRKYQDFNDKTQLIGYLLGLNNNISLMSEYAHDLLPSLAGIPEKLIAYRAIFLQLMEEYFVKTTTSLDKPKFLKTILDIFINQKFLHYALICLPMDVYCLLRVFVTYKSDKLPMGPTGCVSNEYHKNIIIYGGFDHIQTYILFIKKYFQIQPIDYSQKMDIYNQFIDFKEPFRFFQ